jgi:hypothetical protein
MEIDGKMIEIMTDPEKFKEYMRVAIHNHDQQKKAKRDWYYRNKEAISQKRKEAYAAKKGVAGVGSEKGV